MPARLKIGGWEARCRECGWYNSQGVTDLGTAMRERNAHNREKHAQWYAGRRQRHRRGEA